MRNNVSSFAAAIKDGRIVDVTREAQEARFDKPVVVSRKLWDRAVSWNTDNPELHTEASRLWQLLYFAEKMIIQAIKAGESGNDSIVFTMHHTPNSDRKAHEWALDVPTLVKISLTPGDGKRPVVSLVVEDEDIHEILGAK